jgi:mono/diheme cytochrome c family protein
MKKHVAAAALTAVWILAAVARLQLAAAPQTPSSSPALIDYERQIRPIIEASCLECHSADKRKGGLSLATYADALEGGRSGGVIRPGNSTDSLIVHRILGAVEPRMPKDELALDPAEAALIRLWIDQGARATPSSPPAPQPWEAPLALTRPDVPPAPWPAWSAPVDRFVATYLAGRRVSEPALVSDAAFARRVFLDVWGLLPEPREVQAFVADPDPDKRARLVARLLADNQKYAEHWMTFWNDLLRNEDGVSYFSESAGRKSITDWLFRSLTTNLPYDQFVTKLLYPSVAGDPEGFLVGVNWRGETSAAVTPWMQASQNTAQVFLGVNLKCNACHDSFVSKWKLKDAYGLAAYFSPEPKLQLFRCDVARNEYAEPAFLFPELSHTPASSSLADRRAAAARIFTDPRNGRLSRTIVNRMWERLLGRGIVANSDEMDGKPWNPELLDWIASDFVEHGSDVKHLIATLLSSRAYQMPAVARTGEVAARDYVFAGPELRRLTAEQFADAIGSITGEWSVHPLPPAPRPAARTGPPLVDSDPPFAGRYGRQWRAPSSDLSRALGRPIRDQVLSHRPSQATTLQALELVNGEILTGWLLRAARRMLGEGQREPVSLFNKAAGGRTVVMRSFEVDVSRAKRLWLIVRDTGSNAPERVLPVWSKAAFVGPNGVTPLSQLKPLDGRGLCAGAVPAGLRSTTARPVRVQNPSMLVYDVAGKGFTRFRATIGVENASSEVGSTLNPQLRFFVFDQQPNLQRLLPPEPGETRPAEGAPPTAAALVDRIFEYALGRAPSVAERQVAERALLAGGGQSRGTLKGDTQGGHSRVSVPGRPTAEAVADLLWAVLMKPEFQLIY